MNPLIQLKQTSSVFLIAMGLAWLGLSSAVQAVSPAPDGGYPGLNTAEGQNALLNLTSGLANTAVGWFSLSSATTGSFNTGVGAGALDVNTGNENTATGTGALLLNTTAVDNTANGAFALVNNSTGFDNTALGDRALQNNTVGIGNTAVGSQALISNTTASQNTAAGYGALGSNTTGSMNTALGFQAGLNVTTATNVICIGTTGANVPHSCFIGNIRDVTTAIGDAIPVLIDGAGQLGTASSSRRFKTDIRPMDKASESILALRPVSFRYKIHKDSTPQFGLIAEDVVKINPDLVVYDADAKPYTVRYDAVNAMLLNEFLKEHRKVEQLTKDFEGKFAEQQKQIEALTAGLQKVSAQLEATRSALQVVNNNQ